MCKIAKILGNAQEKFDDLDGDKTAFVSGIIHNAGSIADEKVKVKKGKGIATDEYSRYYYWPLCLDDNRDRGSLEIDTCSTSYCISTLAVMRNKIDADEENLKEIDMYIKGGLKTLFKLRRADGTYPPVIDVEKLNSADEYKGGIAMSDNYFALTALLDAGFLNENFVYIFPKEYEGLRYFRNRVEYVLKTVEFFKSKMVYQAYDVERKYGGWYYTDEKDKAPEFLPTANIIILLSRISRIIEKYNDLAEQLAVINEMLHKAGAFLKKMSSTINGVGIGERVGSAEASPVHTCKMIDALISMRNSSYDNTIIKALTATVLNDNNYKDDFLNNTYKYSERYQLLKDVETSKYQNILHESYPESVMLYTLVNVIRYSLLANTSKDMKDCVIKGMSTILDRIEILADRLIQLQGCIGAGNLNLFKSHIRRNDGDYPIYASAESFRAINAWADLRVFYENKGSYANEDKDTYVIERLRADNIEYTENEKELIEKINKAKGNIEDRNASFISEDSTSLAKDYLQKLESLKGQIMARSKDLNLLEKEYREIIAAAQNSKVMV